MRQQLKKQMEGMKTLIIAKSEKEKKIVFITLALSNDLHELNTTSRENTATFLIEKLIKERNEKKL